jgi:MoxR-like ATPase
MAFYFASALKSDIYQCMSYMDTTAVAAPKALESINRLRKAIGATIRGKDDVVDRVVCCLLASGHVLVEDLPGLGKTTLAHCLARAIDCHFSRIQFTSDLLPSDILGVSIYDERVKSFVFRKGPIFANIVLADEINRSTPKTQSSLLEVMDRAKVSVDGESHPVGNPFMVFATQNPVDYEGTFPLPESQLDRFLMCLEMGYPEFDDEVAILRDNDTRYDQINTPSVLSAADILQLQEQTRQVFTEDTVLEYIVRIVQATRNETEFRVGASPRGSIALRLAAQALALTRGRAFVIPEDVYAMVQPVLCHRLSLRRQSSDPFESRQLISACLKTLVDRIPMPT